MRVLIVGAGAVGGYFGALLADAGTDVSFLVRPTRRAAIIEQGLSVARFGESSRHLAVRAVTADGVDGTWDLVLVAVKGQAVRSAIEDIAPAVGADTVVIPLLNGMDHLRLLEARFPGQVIGGVAILATTLDDDGTIRQLMPGGSIAFGEMDGRRTDRIDAIAEAFSAADFTSSVSDTIEQDMWEKWLFMAAGGASTILLGGRVGEIAAVENGRQIVEAVIAEGVATLEAAGHPARGAAVASVTTTLTTDGSPFATSMFRDFQDGRSTEVEPVLADLVDLAGRSGTPVPLLTAATVRLRVYENARG